MNSTTPAGPVANSVFVVAPHKGYPVIPGAVSQVPLYPSNQPQVHLIPGNPPCLVPSVNELAPRKVLKEGKVLGAIQILIGLLHISLGSVMATVLPGFYLSISFYGGFPFWAGIWFIISGSLSVAAENQPNSSCLLNGSVGLNIFSAVCSAVGIILFITDISLVGTYGNLDYYPPFYNWGINPGVAISGVLLIFCLLEFCVACTSSHFGCQLACCQYNNVGMVLPNVYAANPVVVPEPPNSVPSYSNVGQASK
ncbi:membrane-spanning 4-domains subfamily A member 8 [Sciurus carolinensis]|uniref:membrane-spanning 4-domains subfamily A member 8 n=1 Tax=Sciurus carolinensis TaxID=30640 RepID=UPI001FB4410B|nr:membrane-spanning 4-domains subfamily A member 8 [Sciurus carolinensis]